MVGELLNQQAIGAEQVSDVRLAAGAAFERDGFPHPAVSPRAGGAAAAKSSPFKRTRAERAVKFRSSAFNSGPNR